MARARAGTLDRLPDDVGTPFALPWREAAEAWRRIGCPYEQAEALADGDEAAMRESLAILTRLGAEPLADRVRERMRRAGVKRVPARPRASTRTAPAQLTRRQLEVLALVESGLSNAEIARRLFISEKTAGHHVSAILRKLGAGSRGEAAAAARKIGIPARQRRESSRRRGRSSLLGCLHDNHEGGGETVPRYLVKRTFPGGLAITADEACALVLAKVVETNAKLGVTWGHSYVSEDKETTVCVYDAADPEAIEEAAERNGLPVDDITQVSVLDPHFFR